MDAVLDAVNTAKQQFAPTFEQWAGELPAATRDPGAFKAWADQFPTLHTVATALGIDTGGLEVSIAGTMPKPGRRASITRSSTRKRTRTGTRSNGRGVPLSDEQVLTYLREHPGVSAKQIATALHASYDTVQKRMSALEDHGLIRRRGERNNTQWFPAEPAAV